MLQPHSDHEDSPPSLISSPTTSTTPSTPPPCHSEALLKITEKSYPECTLILSHETTQWSVRVSKDEQAYLHSPFEKFSVYLAQRNSSEPSYVEISSELTLALTFLSYVLRIGLPTRALRIVLREFEWNFLTDTDIHTLALELDKPYRDVLLKSYYAALQKTNQSCRPAQSALLREAENGSAKLCAVFGGQGSINGRCFQELSDLCSVYGSLLDELVEVTGRTLNRLVLLANTAEYFEVYGFDIRTWLECSDEVPPREYLSTAPYSFPIIGIISLAHYCITCKSLGRSPGQMRQLLAAVTGHSQGIIVAAAISRADSWTTFYQAAEIAIETLFWIGFESHYNTPTSSLSAAIIRDSVEAGEGQPSPMLSILGADHRTIEQVVRDVNSHLETDEQVYLALLNSRENVVIGGPPKSLRGLNMRLRKIKPAKDLDQSRVLFNERKAVIRHQFLPISAAFHTPYLEKVTAQVLNFVKHWTFSGDDLGVPLFHTNTGEDLRTRGSGDIMESLVRMITTEAVDWPRTCQSFHGTHILDFGPGQVSSFNRKLIEGTGVSIISASQLSPSSGEMRGKSDIFSSILPHAAPNWGELYRPTLIKAEDGKVKLSTKMSRLLGVPPVMVAGMTPCTVPWDFVATIMKAGYHVELAAGGYYNSKDLTSAVKNISRHVPSQSGITVNVIYASPKAIAWQIPLIRQLVQQGLPVTGLTVGAGVPSPTVAKEYIETLGLKHISFKPGSQDAIMQVVDIARAHPHFLVGLQWTGGRGGGHHSYEDFHAPILQTYGLIRRCSNIVLIAGSGFGDASDTLPYLTGTWSRALGYAAMPFDGILIGSRMMVAREAHTSRQVKELIVQTEGVSDSEWHKSYKGATGGVITVQSEMGQPIHKLANRGVLLWHELDRKIFSIKDPAKRLAELQQHRDNIIDRLNNDFQKPWFAVNTIGNNVEIDDMTYMEVLQRLVFLMYVRHQQRWIDSSYEKLVLEFAIRAQERLAPAAHPIAGRMGDPFSFLGAFAHYYPSAMTELLDPRDVSFLLGLCKRRGQKPVNFVPKLDENFEQWFKKDSLWQAEDIDAVLNLDAQRVCIIHGPVAARYSKIVDEPAQAILDGIAHAHVESLLSTGTKVNNGASPTTESSPLAELDHVLVKTLPSQKVYHFPSSGPLPDAESFRDYLSKSLVGWSHACLTDTSVLRGHRQYQNPVRASFVPYHGRVITVNYCSGQGMEIQSLALKEPEDLSPSLILSSTDGKNVKITLAAKKPGGDNGVRVQFELLYSPGYSVCRLQENMLERNERIKNFYSSLWLGQHSGFLANTGLDTEFKGGEVHLTRKMVQDFMTVIKRSSPLPTPQESIDHCVPLDLCIVVAWKALIQPLLIDVIDVDLFRLLHRSNTFEYIDSAPALRLGDILETSSHIQAVIIQANGKLVEVVAIITRQGKPVVRVTSTFIIQGSFSDFENTFRKTQEADIELTVSSEKDQALLSSKNWFNLDEPGEIIIGKTIIFKLSTQVTYGPASQFTSLQVVGQILEKNSLGVVERLGQVYYETGVCHGNPVLDFLNRRGSLVHKSRSLTQPGWNGENSWKIQIPRENSPYSRVSGDTNPIHSSRIFANYAAQLPSTVTHGMYTSAAVRRVVEASVAESDYSRFRKYSASFEDVVLPGDVLRVEMQHVAMTEGRLVLNIKAYNDATGARVLEAEAEVEQAATAYVFTGQGSQEKGMGMALYDSNPAVRTLWDRADKHLLDLYGFSIIDIVRNDPKTLTVHFGGTRGRRIRENYLAMTIESVSPQGHIVNEPIIKGLNPQSASYTFHDPRGLLYSTQFAQPALTLMEMAAFEDVRSKGLVQEFAPYAGHSLGEYSALGALAKIMPMESMLSLVFYRGLAMQVAMKRDDQGRTDFSMVAVNPARVGKGFTQEALEHVVKLVSQETKVLLEVVNYNVEGQQYVCAGHLQALWVMTQVLNDLANPSDSSQHLQLIQKHVSRSSTLSMPIALERGVATIPLSGIDIPFHSTYLRNGIAPYRSFLEGKILEENINLDNLIGKFIPNVLAKPFSVDREYVEEAAEVTGSDILRELVRSMVEVAA